MGKPKKLGFCLLAILILAVVFLPIIIFMHNSTLDRKVVATAEGSKLYYNGETYVEYLNNFDVEIDEYLGRVESLDSHSQYRMYSIRNMPDYIFVRLSLLGIGDYRIYKIVSE